MTFATLQISQHLQRTKNFPNTSYIPKTRDSHKIQNKIHKIYAIYDFAKSWTEIIEHWIIYWQGESQRKSRNNMYVNWKRVKGKKSNSSTPQAMSQILNKNRESAQGFCFDLYFYLHSNRIVTELVKDSHQLRVAANRECAGSVNMN